MVWILIMKPLSLAPAFPTIPLTVLEGYVDLLFTGSYKEFTRRNVYHNHSIHRSYPGLAS
jgi:hypothetical protein